ncbi:restriction endonuclease subunit S, partial [Siphonobacter sp. BAB-5405]|uniref:restriction endonuclease subunit S n=1 Tax=Siphonobacter sp. BAB-5405 TaxID=1864825 RepID=UPI0018ED0C36
MFIILLEGGTPSKAISTYWNGTIPWASIKDISQVEKLESTQDFISEEGLKNSASNVAEPGEIIIGTRMSPGKPVITKIKTAINQDLKIVRSKLLVNNNFSYFLFRQLHERI